MAARTLRDQAEERLLKSRADVAAMSPEEVQALVHELQVHQVELEIQNEEFRRTQDELAAAHDRYRELFEFVPVAYLVLDVGLVIREANRTAAKMFAMERDALVGRELRHLVHPASRGACGLHLSGVLTYSEPRAFELTFRRFDDVEFVGRVDVEPIENEEQIPAGCRATIVDVTDRVRFERQLQRAKELADQANRTKDHFLAVLSHELRTPLTPVVMAVSILQDRPDLDAAMRDTLDVIRRHIDLEAQLIDDLLDVAKIARGKIELSRSVVALCTVIRRAVEVCAPDIEARGLEFAVDLGADAPYWVEADESRLQQVFWNLLKNAIKFTPHGGCVGVRVRGDTSHVTIEVSDSGIGIEREALSRVFHAFEQAERSITRQFGGLGLGLAISKALVEAHGGTIDASSKGRGKGATFRVRLPLAASVARAEAPAGAAPRQTAARSLRILLVEDHGVTAKMMRHLLTGEGHQVETAGDLAAALKLAYAQPFDLLISDLGLPDGTGHDLMRHIRQNGHDLPGIALSGYGQEEDIQHSREAGFAAHLIKPVSRDRLLETIASVTAAPIPPA